MLATTALLGVAAAVTVAAPARPSFHGTSGYFPFTEAFVRHYAAECGEGAEWHRPFGQPRMAGRRYEAPPGAAAGY